MIFWYYLATHVSRVFNTFNEAIEAELKLDKTENTNVCSNTCSYITRLHKKMTISKLLQLIAENRAELCCHKLIDCLLDTYNPYDSGQTDDNISDTSSVEIYKWYSY